jgi:lycopene epsilon-cyclase
LQVDHYPYDAELMIFMDYRDYNIQDTKKSAFEEIPTFLYAMPLSPTRVFFEETCLAARPALPFSLLQERLEARLEKMGIKVIHMHEEEWSYIPVGGTLPDTTQQHLGFGAAASMVHPATGYSVVRSLSEAPMYAAAIAGALGSTKGASSSRATGKNSRAAALEGLQNLFLIFLADFYAYFRYPYTCLACCRTY